VIRSSWPHQGWSVALLCAIACAKPSPPAPAPQPDAGPVSKSAQPIPGSAVGRARIPEGSFRAGTEVGRWQRAPETEPHLYPLSLGAFEIDIAPRSEGSLRVPRARAEQLCTEAGGRLCTELEWERACKGPDSHVFSGGDSFDADCQRRARCVSGFGVRAMGSAFEWTSSEVRGEHGRHFLLRGAEAEQPEAWHRCAHRSLVPLAEGDRREAGFRCCYGPRNAARITEAALGRTYAQAELPLEALSRLLEQDPVTRPLARDLSYFADPKGAEEVFARGPGDTKGFLLTTLPLSWNPVAGAEFLVVAARSGASTSFVVVFHALGAGQYRLAGSFVMRDEPGPIALAYNGYIRPRLHFSSCWGCLGDTGKILYREPDEAVILQP
jgi:hypothetical protein